jgi:nucleoredoxin
MDLLNKVNTFVSNNGEVSNNLSSVKAIGVYFSAHWCPPCKQFTPVLAEFYKQVNASEKVFEVIFVSCDQNEESFKNYLSTMPWIALPFNSEIKEELSDKLQVSGIPRLVIFSPDGKVISQNARNEVVSKGAACFDKWINPVQKKQVDPIVWEKITNGQETKAVSHPHSLKYVDWTQKGNPAYEGGWQCNECVKLFPGTDANLYCSQCSYDICEDCFEQA